MSKIHGNSKTSAFSKLGTRTRKSQWGEIYNTLLYQIICQPLFYRQSFFDCHFPFLTFYVVSVSATLHKFVVSATRRVGLIARLASRLLLYSVELTVPAILFCQLV